MITWAEVKDIVRFRRTLRYSLHLAEGEASYYRLRCHALASENRELKIALVETRRELHRQTFTRSQS